MSRFFGWGAVLIALDQLTKYWFDSHLALGESIPVLQDFFHFTLVYNDGAAFGMFAGWDASIRVPFFVAVALIATAVCVYLYRTSAEYWGRLGAVCIFGGAWGNLIDRVLHSYVIDFLDFFWGSYHWPAFNVADIAISVGAAILLLGMWRERKAVA
ncbi:signal peptidase II [Chrysiogenes arsenatis]|uniref:signal peptidase II n=1 Tax=Chrysiogenes arsenatis TaxID=309797 RepID=UPI0003FFF5B5|nr:signal peptidase II [Chrysiogenes arsenatis]